MEEDSQIISPVLSELLMYLHGQNLYLPPAFDEHIIPMLRDKEFTAADEHVCCLQCLKTDDGILDRAKWIGGIQWPRR